MTQQEEGVSGLESARAQVTFVLQFFPASISIGHGQSAVMEVCLPAWCEKFSKSGLSEKGSRIRWGFQQSGCKQRKVLQSVEILFGDRRF